MRQFRTVQSKLDAAAMSGASISAEAGPVVATGRSSEESERVGGTVRG